jgi:hypothetical protein
VEGAGGVILEMIDPPLASLDDKPFPKFPATTPFWYHFVVSME